MRFVAIVAVLAIAGSAAVASAAPAIEWSAPSACPGRDEVVQRIANQLGDRESSIQAELAATRDGDGRWRLRLAMKSTSGVAGTREIEGASCDEVVNAAATIIALAIQAETPATEPVSTAELVDPFRTPELATQPHAPMQWLARAGLGGEAGALPGVGPGIELAAGGLRGRLRVELALMYLPSRRTMADAQPMLGGELALFAGTVRGCVAVYHGIAPCIDLEVGVMRASGVHTSDPTTHGTGWVAPGVGVIAPWRLSSSFYFTAHADAAAPLIRPHFMLDGAADDLFRPAAVVARLWFAIEARFP